MKKSVGKALETAIRDKDKPDAKAPSQIKRIFANKKRRKILSILTYAPCQNISALARAVGISNVSVNWHLDKLKEAGYIVERKHGKRRFFWPEGLIDEGDIPLFCLLSHETSRTILLSIIRAPGISQKEVSGLVRISHQGVSSWVKGMLELGLVDAVSEGVHTRYYPTTLLKEKSEANYEKAKAFRKYLADRLKTENEKPKAIKASQRNVLIEIGPANDRVVLDIGLDPFFSVLDADIE